MEFLQVNTIRIRLGESGEMYNLYLTQINLISLKNLHGANL
jgi:hypothetical protein